MILEIAHLTIRPGQNSAFEQAFAQAQCIIASMPGYLSHELGIAWSGHRTMCCWCAGPP